MASTLAFGFVLAVLLMALARVDLARMILPDWLNGLVAVGGLCQALWLRDPDLIDAFLGATLAGCLLLGVAIGYRRLRGVEGLGLGDVKLAAAGATWSGVAGVGPMLLVATASCSLIVLLGVLRGRPIDAQARIPFGPFLALGMVLSFFAIADQFRTGGGSFLTQRNFSTIAVQTATEIGRAHV